MRTGREGGRHQFSNKAGGIARGRGHTRRYSFKLCLELKVLSLNFFENCQKMQISRIEI